MKEHVIREGADSEDRESSRTASANESQSKHTPGPWRAGFGSEDDRPRPGEFELAELPHHIYGMGIYAPGDYYSDKLVEHVANAQLIAAAPDLLAALKAIVAMYGPSSDYSYEAAEAWRVCEAAIAKAEGR